jgi:hypothetical protein
MMMVEVLTEKGGKRILGDLLADAVSSLTSKTGEVRTGEGKKFAMHELVSDVIHEPECMQWLIGYYPLAKKLHAAYFRASEPLKSIEACWLTFCRDWGIVPGILSVNSAVELLRTAKAINLPAVRVERSDRKKISRSRFYAPPPADQIANNKKHSIMSKSMASTAKSIVSNMNQTQMSSMGDTAHFDPTLFAEALPDCAFGPEGFAETLVKIPFHFLTLYGNNYQSRLNTAGKLAWLSTYLKEFWMKSLLEPAVVDSRLLNLCRSLCVSDFELLVPPHSDRQSRVNKMCPTCERYLAESHFWGSIDCHVCNVISRRMFDLSSSQPTNVILSNAGTTLGTLFDQTSS